MRPDLDDAVALALVGMRRIAVVGLSDDPARPSHRVARSVLRAGWDVVPVNPTAAGVLDRQAFPDLASVPGRIDVVLVFRAPEHLPAVARAAVARDDVGVVWNQLGLRSAAARDIVRTAGRGYVEDRCLAVEVERRGATPPTGPRLGQDVVLLDLDDTVLDHEACQAEAATRTLDGFSVRSDAAALEVYGRHNAAAWSEYRRGELTPATLRVARWARTLDELGATAHAPSVASRYLEEFASVGATLPGAVEAVWWLRRRARVGIATNGFAEVQAARLAATGVADLVDTVVSSEDVGVAKPDPAALTEALRRVGAGEPTRTSVAMVGDQLATDVAAGAAIGATTVWIAPEDAVVPAGGPVPDIRVPLLADVV